MSEANMTERELVPEDEEPEHYCWNFELDCEMWKFRNSPRVFKAITDKQLKELGYILESNGRWSRLKQQQHGHSMASTPVDNDTRGN